MNLWSLERQWSAVNHLGWFLGLPVALYISRLNNNSKHYNNDNISLCCPRNDVFLLAQDKKKAGQ